MSKKVYTTLVVVDHDNKRYEIGATVDLDDKQAEALLDVGAISGPTGEAASEPPTDAKVRLAAITTAIGQLDPNNLDLWLKDGKPSTDAIAAITGWPLSAAERDAAWAALNG